MNEEQITLYDEAFTIHRARFGLYRSVDTEGNGLITSLSEEGCINATRWYLKAKQDGTLDNKSAVTYDSVVGGKL